jgi:ribose-phosphate pyrophosphokinase
MKHPPIIFPLAHDDLGKTIQKKCRYELGKITQHQFPDEETVIQIDSNVTGRDLIFITSLDRPNTKLVPLLFAAKTARSLGAEKITLVAPYLAYMRQDKVFEAGQGITSKYVAELISHYFDGLITIDPHLHRWHTLSAIYDIPTTVLHATNNIARWIHTHIEKPILIGPDSESMQWVEEIAKKSKAPFLILEKIRKGDENVEISIPNIEKYQNCTPLLIDDIISTGMTMMGTVAHLKSFNMRPPICIGVHAVFAGDAYQKLSVSGVEKIITCNTIQHCSNGIDISTNIINLLGIMNKEKNE